MQQEVIFRLFFVAFFVAAPISAQSIVYEREEFGYRNVVVISNNGWAQKIPWPKEDQIQEKIRLVKTDSLMIAGIFSSGKYKKLLNVYDCSNRACKEDAATEKILFITSDEVKSVSCDNGIIHGIPTEYFEIQEALRRITGSFSNAYIPRGSNRKFGK